MPSAHCYVKKKKNTGKVLSEWHFYLFIWLRWVFVAGGVAVRVRGGLLIAVAPPVAERRH